jgi:two-component system cell cycle response regulator
MMVEASDILQAKVLIVDDVEANVDLLERMLKRAGYTQVSSTQSPQTVCDLYRQHAYDLILLDLQMPTMDGFQVMEALKLIEIESYLPVLVITAQPDHKLRALKSGARDFVTKPFDRAEVLMRVHNMLEVRLLHKQVREYAKMLEALAMQDALTGLANRRSAADRIEQAITHARRSKGSMAVMYLDLDGFKKINDTLGHDVGDELLKLVAGRLVGVVREEDTVARLGGDEFMIALWQIMGEDGAVQVAAKAVEAVSKPYDIKGNTIVVTTSAGVGCYPTHGVDADTLMKSADLALYEAKHSGKNAYRVSSRAVTEQGEA